MRAAASRIASGDTRPSALLRLATREAVDDMAAAAPATQTSEATGRIDRGARVGAAGRGSLARPAVQTAVCVQA